ncbi:hypothetical protein LEN26_014579 [Aphanomyces euteiches]|nr:hypothetical protein LEN26_014579 [Aphanomyces euteiches]
MLARVCLQVALRPWTLRTFSSKPPNISLQAQKDILRVAQCVHEMLGRPEITHLTPALFRVPEEKPFPNELHGKTFKIAYIRRAKQDGRLDADIVAQLDAIGFSWDGNEQKSNQEWEENIEALRIYKAIHGNLNVPHFYKVEMGDVQWPEKLWGKRLGYTVGTLRKRQERIEPERREILDSMGFVWDAMQAKWEKNLLALETYKATEGNLLVKHRFVVPDQDPAWPKDTWNMNLGKFVAYCRKKKDALPRDIHDALTAMGFVWKVRDKRTGPGQPPYISFAKQQEILEIVQAQRKLQGHTRFTTLPRTLKVLSSSEWPKHLHGCIVNVSEFRRAYRMGLLDSSIVAKLDELGFVWNDKQHQWSLTMEALRTFKKIYGHLEVPKVFEVPKDDRQWPVYLSTMKLGTKVGTIRARQTKLTWEQRQELAALDFVWDANKLHWHRNLSALKTYKQFYGDMRIPTKFVVPQDDPAWPVDLANIKLGLVVSRLRSNQETLSDEKMQELTKLGFEWGVKSSSLDQIEEDKVL